MNDKILHSGVFGGLTAVLAVAMAVLFGEQGAIIGLCLSPLVSFAIGVFFELVQREKKLKNISPQDIETYVIRYDSDPFTDANRGMVKDIYSNGIGIVAGTFTAIMALLQLGYL